MHKQCHKRNRKSKPRLKNANSLVPLSVTNQILDLLKDLESEGTFALDYLREEYLSKLNSEDIVPAADRKAAAIAKWLSVESKNAATNRRLRGLDRGYNILPRVTWYSFLRFAQKIVSDVLGDLDDSIVLGSFSGGASTSRRRTESHPAQKFVGEADITESAVPFVDVIHREAPLLKQYRAFYDLREVVGAVLFTVPKKTEIDRCACKEPDVNMFLQKGVGGHIRRRLRRFGINLNDQSINRKLACRGSLLGDLATLDLSSASDTMTISAVQALLPTVWFEYLNSIRSHVVEVEGTLVRTEMFSSMGNGFTFELESLLFYALMRAVSYFEGISGVISVYGDDLIIPSGMYDSATWVLNVFGFTVNEEKSFHTGPFRESCGGHYHAGEDVTPFYLKRVPTRLTDVIRVANQLRRWALAEPSRQYMVAGLYELWTSIINHVPKDLWGGYDHAVDTQIVSPHAYQNRLLRVTGKKVLPPAGEYLSWHNSTWQRVIPGVPSRDPVETTSVCRRRRVPNGAIRCTEYFHEEVLITPNPEF